MEYHTYTMLCAYTTQMYMFIWFRLSLISSLSFSDWIVATLSQTFYSEMKIDFTTFSADDWSLMIVLCVFVSFIPCSVFHSEKTLPVCKIPNELCYKNRWRFGLFINAHVNSLAIWGDYKYINSIAHIPTPCVRILIFDSSSNFKCSYSMPSQILK